MKELFLIVPRGFPNCRPEDRPADFRDFLIRQLTLEDKVIDRREILPSLAPLVRDSLRPPKEPIANGDFQEAPGTGISPTRGTAQAPSLSLPLSQFIDDPELS